MIVFDELLRVVRSEGLTSVFIELLLRSIIIRMLLFLTWKVNNILGALFNERIANHIPLISKQREHTLLFHFKVRGLIHGNLRRLAQIVMDPENVRVGSVAGNLLTLKNIPRRVRLRKEML